MVTRFIVDDFAAFMTNLERACAYVEIISAPPPSDTKPADLLLGTQDRFESALQGILDASESVALSYPVQRQIERLLAKVQTFPVGGDYSTLATEARVVRQTLLDDLSQHSFFYIPAKYRNLMDRHSTPFGSGVHAVFADATWDIEAAGRCLALGEWTASVFHSMRTVEHGLRTFAQAIGIPFSASVEFENWKNIIDQIESEIRKLERLPRSPAKSLQTTAYSGAASQFRYFKDAWRNHVSHSRTHYDEQGAEDIYNHTRQFMQSVAGQIATMNKDD